MAQRPRVRVEWGVLGGINFSDFSAKLDQTNVKDKLGWQVGMLTAINFGAVAIEPQILFVRNGMKIREAGYPELNLRSNSIDVPILFSLRILKPLRFNIGPVFTVMNDCKEKVNNDLLDFGRVRPTVSYTIGLGVTIMKHLLLDFRYNGQFGSKNNIIVGNDWSLDLRSYSLAFSVGYVF